MSANVLGSIRGTEIRGINLRKMAGIPLEPVVRPRFRHSLPKLYVGTDKALAEEIASFAKARQTVPVDLLLTEVKIFFLA